MSTPVGFQEADHLFEVICEQLRHVHGEIDENRLRMAYELALSAHEPQVRLDGSPYVTHVLEVAELCAGLNMDEDAIIAAILHDTVEDTSVKLQTIRQMFGPQVATMVDSLTKIKKIDFFARFLGRDRASNQARNLQKLFVAMSRDTRVIVVKLADRLHNMKTLGSMPEHKQQRISKETLEFYIPLARRLGLGRLTSELEDLVFQYLYPARYKELRGEVDSYIPRQERQVDMMIATLSKALKLKGIKIHRIYGRRKHLWSIFQKMERQGVDLQNIYDILAIRIILDGEPEDCYVGLGILHMQYKPIFHRFRDFIASPKENGYQTLHTTVVGPEGTIVECQIRTHQMDTEAEQGIASHWKYKETGFRLKPPPGTEGTQPSKDETWLEFIRELAAEGVEGDEFVARTRETILADQVLVLSPKGEVVSLPAGSTPVDFAYYIHTDLGHSVRGAKVNGSMVALDYVLRNGDVVEAIKGEPGDRLPRPEWMVIAKSPNSLLKIRKHFKALPQAERIAHGRSLLRQQIVKEGLYPLNLTANDKLAELLRRLHVRSIDDLYDKVAIGSYSCDEIIEQLKEIHLSRLPSELEPVQAGEQAAEVGLLGTSQEIGLARKDGTLLRAKIELMPCCTPVRDDKVYGVYDRKERRVRVHRVECPLLQEQLTTGDLLDLIWVEAVEERYYPARFSIVSLNRVGLLFEVLRYLAEQRINLGGAVFNRSAQEDAGERSAHFELSIDVLNTAGLEQAMAAVRRIDDVLEVSRIIGPQPAPSSEKP
jgi:GTP diphosphokinase / guanosine-3',5'-bis(diphosphate) 3'-diphosphatase